LLNAVRQGTAAAFEQVHLGGDTLLVNPLAGLALDFEGTDSLQTMILPFPRVASQALPTRRSSSTGKPYAAT
jgi:hypothetical protein